MEEELVLPKDHFRKRISHQYENIPKALVREVIQNSQDAGATRVTFEIKDGWWEASDTGCGMTLQEFRDYYLTLGGTKKETGSIGGFGAAKEILSFAWEKWWALGQGFKVEGSGAENPESTDGGTARGFIVGAEDSYFGKARMAQALKNLVFQSALDLDVFLKMDGRKEKLGQARKLRENQIARKFDFGTLYVHKSARGNEGYLIVRTRGLFTFEEWVGGGYTWYLDLQAASPEVLTENRDALRKEIKSKVRREVESLKNSEKIEERSSPTLTFYRNETAYTGRQQTEANGAAYADGREFKMHTKSKDLWRDTFVVAEEGTRARLVTGSGNPRPMYTKALEIISELLDTIADITGVQEAIPGLYFGQEGVSAIHGKTYREHIVCVKPKIVLEESPFFLLEILIHEMAHYYKSSHCQKFEDARMHNLVQAIGEEAPRLLTRVKELQGRTATRGRYWR